MKSFVKAAALALTVVFAAPAKAALIEMDLNSAGDSLITFDTVSSLEWLDLTATKNLSASGALSTTFVTVQGFRLATAAEILALWAGVGVTPAFPGIAGNFAGVHELILKMGCTGNCNEPGFEAQNGYTADWPSNLAVIALRPGPVAHAFVTNTPDVSARSTRGNFLVRASTPLPGPGAALLLGFGLVGIIAARRRVA